MKVKVEASVTGLYLALALLASLIVLMFVGAPRGHDRKQPKDPFRMPANGFQQQLPASAQGMDVYLDALHAETSANEGDSHESPAPTDKTAAAPEASE